jgi:hypothetical protein
VATFGLALYVVDSHRARRGRGQLAGMDAVWRRDQHGGRHRTRVGHHHAGHRSRAQRVRDDRQAGAPAAASPSPLRTIIGSVA